MTGANSGLECFANVEEFQKMLCVGEAAKMGLYLLPFLPHHHRRHRLQEVQCLLKLSPLLLI
jgi:hypothetical protein